MFRDCKGRIFIRQQAVTIQRGLDKRLLTLPKRPHGHCDSFCEECQDIVEEYERRIQPVMDAAFAKFWDVVRAWLPQLKGDAPSYTDLNTKQMRADALAAITDWAFEEYGAPICQAPFVSNALPVSKTQEERVELDLAGSGTDNAKEETRG